MDDIPFIGREFELNALQIALDQVRRTGAGTGLAIRGRRQIGKSRLVREFCKRAGVPFFFFTARKGTAPATEVSSFLRALEQSSLVVKPVTIPQVPMSWETALGILANTLPEQPSIVVLDEAPWLAEQDGGFESELQIVWDHRMSRRPVLLLLLGSDIHMMERLTAYDRPLYGRARPWPLNPLNPLEVSAATGLPPADTIDAHLVSGGLPGILAGWPQGMPALEFLKAACSEPASAVFTVPETALLAEFPTPDTAMRVLQAIGSGDRTFANIAAAAGNSDGVVPSGTLSPILARLTRQKRVIDVDEPLSTRPGKPSLYRVADSNLRLYFGIMREAQDLVLGGEPDAARSIIERRWTSWRGRAVEPLIRDALRRTARREALPWDGVGAVGGWWNRQFDPEVDLVGADRGPVAGTVHFVGSIKWLGTPFDGHDLAKLRNAAVQVPGFDFAHTGLVVASLSGIAEGLDLGSGTLVWSADDVVDAYRTSWSA